MNELKSSLIRPEAEPKRTSFSKAALDLPHWAQIAAPTKL